MMLSSSQLLLAGFRSLFLESSFNDSGRQNLGYAAVVEPLFKSMGLEGPRTIPPLRPFNTNPFLSGLVIGVSLSLLEGKKDQFSPDKDLASLGELVSCLASATGAKGDQLLWNTWLQFSALLAFFVTWRFQAPWGPFLLPLVFSLVALPVRFLGLFWGYREGVSSIGGRLNALVLGLRRRLQTLVLFAQGLLTALVLDSVPQTEGAASPRVLFFASAFFLSILLGTALFRRWPKTLIGVYLLEIFAMYLILSKL
ncbi:MAG: PTS system mannose/fructose/sorbose family transporter subunit IID [Deltaproteobacteria bacterium]|jgi:PTS system mannose-specific IID component|nr:PTS system mannose/fructose/sorbose family transporter subunit IID [Deltaproteobacteria bacterium]